MATNLKILLIEKNLKQIQIARDLKIDSSRLSKFINGWQKLPEKHELALASYLGIPVEKLRKHVKESE